MYFADDAVAEGLANEIGFFNRAVQLALELADGADSAAGDAGASAATNSTTAATISIRTNFPP
jgi:hypothetical protein